MRFKIYSLIILLVVVIAGCSTSSGGERLENPIAGSLNDEPHETNQEYFIINSGSFNIEDESISLSGRSLSTYFDVTGFVGPNFSFYINRINPPDILDITLSLNNLSGLLVHDVVIVFNNLYTFANMPLGRFLTITLVPPMRSKAERSRSK